MTTHVGHLEMMHGENSTEMADKLWSFWYFSDCFNFLEDITIRTLLFIEVEIIMKYEWIL